MILRTFVVGLGVAAIAVACGDTGDLIGEGCASDADCKGDRVCDEGTCRTPGSASETGATAASGGPGGASANTSSGNVTAGQGPSTGAGGPNAPVFLDFGTSVSAITGYGASSSVTFTAVLTDPDGVDDLIGGTLKDESGSPYGAFATSGQEGAYALALTWEQIDATSSITFAPGTNGQRSFVAEFFDVAGHKVQATATLTLDCRERGACGGNCGQISCDGTCVWASSTEENRCGSCEPNCFGGHCTDDDVCEGVENTDALCSDGLDNDGDGYFDCVDFNCSMNSFVTVCG